MTPQTSNYKRDTFKMLGLRFEVICLLFALSGCSPQRYFYYPNKQLYYAPETMHVTYDMLEYPSLNGKTLYAILMRTPEKPRGTVVHFHGNFGNLSNHFPLSIFLLKRGFDVLIFDYEGYGASEGHPTPEHTVEDGIATIRYAQAHLRDPHTGVVLLGQSLGGAVGVVVTAKEPLVKAAVIEAGFSSYSTMGKEVLQRSAWTWLFSWVAPAFLSKKYDPIRYVADISPRPVFFIHGDKDKIVPLHMSQDLYEKAKEPKRIWIVPGAGHLDCHRIAGKKYEEEIVNFYDEAIKGSAGK
jgi:fermentation-respiration switch protein FrsA (DUF1100 family)